jgi:hypothetical protein
MLREYNGDLRIQKKLHVAAAQRQFFSSSNYWKVLDVCSLIGIWVWNFVGGGHRGLLRDDQVVSVQGCGA